MGLKLHIPTIFPFQDSTGYICNGGAATASRSRAGIIWIMIFKKNSFFII